VSFPSTYLDIQNKVILKATLDANLDRANVKDWINRSYFQVCVETEANPGTATMTMTAAAGSYTLPAGIARVRQMAVKPAGSTQFNQPMVLTTLDEILQRRQSGGDTSAEYAQPTLYTVVGINDLEVWPTPTAADVITVYYAAFPTALSADADVPILEEPYGSNLLEYGALVQAGDFKGDPATPGWESQFDRWMGKYLQHLKVKRGEQPGQFHTWGGGWDDSASGTAADGW
jgi:hypothetical protein